MLAVMRGYDLIGLTETGCDPSMPPVVLPGLRCVANLPRAQRSVQGGIALYAREGVQRWVRVSHQDAEHGVLWVRVNLPGFASLHVALCYMPPEDSMIRARTRAEKHRAMHAEWQSFGDKACEFGRSGSWGILMLVLL